ncbi:amino acid ABC transporter permease [Micromonospora sp. DT4]|uniref:amino acid ABC transporter permease n=1 Tax=Micromonospora sp. DT4 TaxID=3393438 RepID=UPI003CF5DDE6
MDVVGHLGRLWDGLLVTLQLTILSFAGALIFGVVLAVMRISPILPVRVLAGTYVELVRNIPLLVLLVIFVFGVPEIGIMYSLFLTVVTAMALYGAAFVSETVRTGVAAVTVNEAEAARALGMTTVQTIWHIILPRALRAMIQPLGSVFISIALGSSLAAAVGVSELTGQTDMINLEYADSGSTLVISSALYVGITLSGGLFFGWLERRLAVHR